MRLYHFINKKYGLEDLRERRLKIGRIMELNDPFEFMGVDLSDRKFRESMERTKRDLSEKFGLLCFSESWNNPVQWAHYAEGHKGFCLGFDISDHLPAEVIYIDEPLSVDFSDELKLKEVIVGVRSCITRAKIEDVLGGMTGSVEIFKVRPDFRKFVMVRDQNRTF